MKVVYCGITSWKGRVQGAEHYYVDLVQKVYPRNEVSLRHNLTGTEADRLNRRNPDKRWEAGEEVRYFFDRDRAVRAAVTQYKLLFPGAIILVEGDCCTYEPQPILDGPQEVMEAINELYKQAEEIYWWEEDEETMQSISDAWKAIWMPEFEKRYSLT